MNSPAHGGAECPCRDMVIKMLCAQLKTRLHLRGSRRTLCDMVHLTLLWLTQIDVKVFLGIIHL